MSNLATLDLPDGQWFRYHAQPSHGQIKVITRRLIELSGTPDILDIQTTTVLTLGDAWLVRDSEGRDLPWNTEGVDAASQEIVQLCVDACEKVINGASPALGNDLASVPRRGRRKAADPNR